MSKTILCASSRNGQYSTMGRKNAKIESKIMSSNKDFSIIKNKPANIAEKKLKQLFN